MYKHVPTFVGKTLTNQWIRLLEGNSLHWLQQDRTLHRASPNLLFPTSLCGVLVFDSVSRHLLLIRRLLRRRLFHTHPSVPHIFVTRNLSHTSLSTTIFQTQLCQPPTLSHTSLSHTHTICHTHLSQPTSATHILSHTIFHTQLCHIPSFTDLSQSPSLSHTQTPSFTDLSQPPSFTQLCHIPSITHKRGTWSTTIFHTQLCHIPSITHKRGTWRHPPSFCVAGVALRVVCWLWWRGWGWF